MVIKDIKTGIIRIPLVTPFKTALRTVEYVEDLIVCVETDSGETGYGEAPATAVITGDTLGSVQTAIKDFITPAIRGMDIMDMDGIQRKLHSCILKNTSAKAAVDMALYDLYAKSLKTPLYKLLGGNAREIETDLTISVNDIPQMVSDSLEAVKKGFSILKIKVGKEGFQDVERIAYASPTGSGAQRSHQGATRTRRSDQSGCQSGLECQGCGSHHFQNGRYGT